METATFCQEVESGVTQQQIDQRVNELRTLGGAINAYAKTVGGRRYICAVRKVFNEPLDDEVHDPERAGPVMSAAPPAAGGTAGVAAGGLLTDEDYRRAAATLGCEVAAIRADDLLDLLGIEISPARLKCAMLSHDSLQHVLGDLGVATPAEASAGSGA